MSQSNQQRQPAQGASAPTTMPPKKVVAIGDLLISPPEQAPYESFSHQCPKPATVAAQVGLAAATKPHLRPQQAPSPPISPLTKVSNQVHATVHDVKDPILYPEEPASPARPLFERRLSPEAQNAVSEHMAARQVAPLPAGVKLPARQDYELFLCFRENAYHRFFTSTPAKQNEWLRREKAQLMEDAKARNGGKAKLFNRPIIKAKPLMARPSETITARTGLIKSATSPRGATKVVKPASSRPVRVSASKPARSRASATPQPEKKRTTTQADQDFNAIPDYCPPLDTLTPDNVMRTPQATNAREFEKNELHLLPLLHPDEQQVASNLRLDPATYLTSKRRIFHKRLQFYHDGKTTFRKTHAQVACRIDVNKASKLWTAFESVGWLDEKWVRNLPRPADLHV